MNVALYARYSTDKQDARSIDDQLRRCRAFAQARGWSVVRTEKDEALSGAQLARPGLQRLLAMANERAFEAVIVDDLSRLSRDLGHAWNLIFGDLASRGVRVVDATTGMASDAAGARLTFGALALVNDTFLQLVKTETHRGLEGRALEGFWTGGSCYGYRTVPEANPQDPTHPRSVPVIHDAEAEVVREVFRRYAHGDSLLSLVEWLNGSATTAPADGASKKKARGWSKSLLHSMLRNERYVGEFIWNKRKWTKDPASGKRRYVERPESEWVRVERPELAIVDRDTWERVQARHQVNAIHRPNRKREVASYLLSGLLRCGMCGGSMSVVARRVKDGVAYAQFGCSVRHSRGESACSNRRTIGERGLSAEVLEKLRTHLASPQVETWLSEVIAAHDSRQAGTATDEHSRLRADVALAEARVEKVTEALARIGYSEPLARKLQAEEARLLDARQRLAASTPAKARRPRQKVTAARLLELLSDLETVARKRPAQARLALAAVVESIVLAPQPDGNLKATLRLKNETAALASGRSGVDLGGCGGRI